MADLGDLHTKINSVVIDVSYLRGKLDAILPEKGKTICTREDLRESMAEHIRTCMNRPSRAPQNNIKAYKIGGGIIAGLVAGAVAVAKYFF
jgi:hypothetical protein